MSWAEIKKSVNSNLSKPLDELIKEISQNYIIPSDDENDVLIASIENKYITGASGANTLTLLSFTCLKTGIYKISAQIKSSAAVSGRSYLTVLDSSGHELVKFVVATTEYIDVTAEFSMFESDMYTVQIFAATNYQTIARNVKIYGRPVTRAEYDAYTGAILK